MAITNGNYVTPQIANTTQLEKLRDGILYVYEIAPVDGYVLHDNAMDYPATDENGNDTGEMVQVFTEGTCSCAANYDFVANPREFFTMLKNEVPTDQIHGSNNDHETI